MDIQQLQQTALDMASSARLLGQLLALAVVVWAIGCAWCELRRW
jgi:diacylglycerol kinase